MSWLLGCKGNVQELEVMGSFRCVFLALTWTGTVDFHRLFLTSFRSGMTRVFTVFISVSTHLSVALVSSRPYF